MSDVRYLYAFNNECVLTEITNAERNNQYFCPLCLSEMIPKQGRKNKWHYAHKNSVIKCSYESYLHKIAKELICNHFNNTSSFKINYCVANHCNINCSFNLNPKCTWPSRREFNLLDYYDTCEIEAEYKGYRADLLLYNKLSSSLEPIFIEICVKHPCSQEKIESNIRIIEVKIESEDDINRIINKSTIYESDGYINTSVIF